MAAPPPGGDDLCECIFNHEAAMRRLMDWVLFWLAFLYLIIIYFMCILFYSFEILRAIALIINVTIHNVCNCYVIGLRIMYELIRFLFGFGHEILGQLNQWIIDLFKIIDN